MSDPTAATIDQAAADDTRARLQRIKDAWTAYHAEHPEPLRARRTTNEAGETVTVNDNVKLGWNGDAVDTGVHWLFGDGAPITVALDAADPDGAETKAAQEWLDRVLENSGGPLLELELATLGAISGHAMLRINTLNPAPVDAGAYRRDPTLLELAVIDSADADAEWLPRNIHRATRWELTFRVERHGPEEAERAGLERHTFTPDNADRPTAWEMTVDRTDRSGRWVRYGDAVRWPYPWPPVIDAQNIPAPGQFWGRSDIDAVAINLTRAGIARASDLNRTARLHGHPSAVAKGMTPTQVSAIDLGSDKITALPDPTMGLDYLEHKVGPSSSTEWLAELHDQFREHVRVPAVAAGRLDAAGALSGVALRILFAPLLQATAVKRLTYGRLLADATRRLLKLGGWDGAGAVQWPDLLPVNELETWQTALIEQQAGVSVATTLTARGADAIAEAEARAQEAAAATNAATSPYLDPPPTGPVPPQ